MGLASWAPINGELNGLDPDFHMVLPCRSGALQAGDAEVLVEHAGFAGESRSSPLEHESARRQHIDIVRRRQRELQVLLHEQDGLAQRRAAAA